MNDKVLYWIWLTLCFPPANRRMLLALEHMDPEALYEKRQDPGLPFLTSADLHRLRTVSLASAEKVLTDCQKLEVELLTMEDPAYPRRLREIDSPPPVLYYQGDLSNLDDALTIGVVGTRRVSDYYRRATGNISYQLARAGAVIVSGCAVGCDEYGHRGALRAGGRTVGVLACGFGVNYPAETRELREAMLQRGGALISELPPGTGKDSGYFRIRNRLIAALSEGVLVTQVPVRSGALLTADHAVEQGKELFCLPPNDIFSPDCMGSASLIRDGARVIFSARDILDEYLERFGPAVDQQRLPAENMTPPSVGRRTAVRSKPDPAAVSAEKPEEVTVPQPEEQPAAPAAPQPEETPVSPAPLPEELSENQRKILKRLEEGPAHVEDLLTCVEAAPYELLALLTELELLGLVRALSGQRYERS